MAFKKYNNSGAYHWRAFSRNPRLRNSWNNDRYIKCIELLKEKTNKKELKVLDVGCGDGALTYLLDKNGYEATGIDQSKIGIELAILEHNVVITKEK
jgi:2-polyprenyl-3-methyl-5-hydroxy-6-metoxy-1,4-benzoquinol methylase